MPDSPEGAYSPSDAEIDEIVESLEGGDSAVATDDASAGAGPDEGEERLPADTRVGAAKDEGAEPAEAARPTAGGAEPATKPAAEAAPAAPGAPAAPAEKPFTFKAEGKDYQFPGIKLNEDGSATVPKEQLGAFKQYLAEGVAVRQRWPQEKRTYEKRIRQLERERDETRSAKDIEADAIIAQWEGLFKLPADQRYQALMDLEEQMPKLRIDIEKKKLDFERQEFERERSGAPATPEDEEEQVYEGLNRAVQETLKTLFAHPAAKYLTDEDKQDFAETWRSRAHTLLGRATEDGDGYKKGELIVNDDDVIADFRRTVLTAKRQQDKAEAARKTAEANAQRNADLGGSRIPPTVARGTTSQAGTKSGKGDEEEEENAERAARKRRRRRGVRERFLSGELDSPDVE